MGLFNTSEQAYYTGSNFGNYQFTDLQSIIDHFMFVYVGEDKIIPTARKLDVAFHAQRALAELSFDTFKSTKAQEIIVPASLQMILPHDACRGKQPKDGKMFACFCLLTIIIVFSILLF